MNTEPFSPEFMHNYVAVLFILGTGVLVYAVVQWLLEHTETGPSNREGDS